MANDSFVPAATMLAMSSRLGRSVALPNVAATSATRPGEIGSLSATGGSGCVGALDAALLDQLGAGDQLGGG